MQKIIVRTATIQTAVAEITTIVGVKSTPTVVNATKEDGTIKVAFSLTFPRTVQGQLGDDVHKQLVKGLDALKEQLRNENYFAFEGAKAFLEIEEESFVAENHTSHVHNLGNVSVRAYANRPADDDTVVISMTVTFRALRKGRHQSGTRETAYGYVDAMREKAYDQIGSAFDRAKALFKTREVNDPEPVTITVIGVIVEDEPLVMALPAPVVLQLPEPANTDAPLLLEDKGTKALVPVPKTLWQRLFGG